MLIGLSYLQFDVVLQAETSNGAAEEETAAPEEECAAEFKPLVELQEVETVSGEEEEKELCNLCAPYPPFFPSPPHNGVPFCVHRGLQLYPSMKCTLS